MASTIIPTLRYHDAPAAIAWLCEVLGAERQAVYDDGKGGIVHAQLTLGGGMIMLGSARDDAFGKLQSTARSLGGNSQSAYVVVADARAVHDRALAKGGDIVRALQEEDYGGWAFSFHDPEGNLWNVGEYDPWGPHGS